MSDRLGSYGALTAVFLGGFYLGKNSGKQYVDISVTTFAFTAAAPAL
jgi:hypothetical protein